ncbi:MAG: 3-phosphoshikimate 1-carboxyvinyltransferase, partial [Chloroflexi bacterium]
MDDLRPITPLRRPLADKRVAVPPSKSVANRELILSALAKGRSRLELGPMDPGDDVRAMVGALGALGYRVDWDGGEITVHGGSSLSGRAGAVVDAHDAGTVARFATALAALGSGF